MLSKILILVGICVGVYIVTQRHKLFPGIFGDKLDNSGSGNSNSGNWKQNKPARDQSNDAIEELDYDPKTGHYRVNKSKKDKN